MNKIKQQLRRWLGVEEAAEKAEVARESAYKIDLYMQHRIDACDQRISKIENVIGKTIRAGFDHHIRQPSWMVVAWRDEKDREHVHFYEVDRKVISDINDMLKNFKRENVFVDTHPQIAPHFKW